MNPVRDKLSESSARTVIRRGLKVVLLIETMREQALLMTAQAGGGSAPGKPHTWNVLRRHS